MKGMEEKVADRLKGAQSTSGVDGGALWESIGAELDAGKPSGAFFTWSKGLGVLVLLLGIGGAIYLWNSQDSEFDSNSIVDHSFSVAASQNTSSDQQTSLESREIYEKSPNIDSESVPDRRAISRIIGQSEKNQELDESQLMNVAVSETEIDKSSKKSTSEIQNAEEDHRGRVGEALEDNARTVPRKPGLVMDDELSVERSDSQIGSSTEKEGADYKTELSSTKGQGTPDVLVENLSSQLTPEISKAGHYAEVEYRSPVQLEVRRVHLREEKPLFQVRGVLSEIEPINYVRSSSLLPNEVSLLAGLNYSAVSLDFPDLEANVFSPSFTSRTGYSTFFLGSWNIGKNLHLKTGIGQELLKHRFDNLHLSDTDVTVEDHIIGLEMDSLGTVSPIWGSHSQSAVSERSIEHYNAFRIVSVPLMLGYEKDLGNLNVGIELGVSMNWVTYQMGRSLEGNGEILDFTKDSGLLSSSFVSYSVLPSIDYVIDKRLDIKLAPSVSVTSKNKSALSGAQNQLTRYRLLVGLGYRIR